MSWDIVSKAVETVLTNAILGIGRLAPMLPLSPAPDTEVDGREPASPAPEGPAGQPSPPQGPLVPPPAPPVPPEGVEGPAAEAAKEEARRVGEMLEQLVELDSAGISAEEVAAAGEVGRQELEDIRADVTAKIEQMKADGSLYTVEGQKTLMDFVKTRLEEARTIIEKAAADSEDKAAVSQENATKYSGVGTAPDSADGGGSGGGNEAPAEADSAQGEAQTNPAGMLGQPGLGMGMPMGGLPGFGGGGGGLPGFGGGGGLPGFGGGGGLPTGFMDPLASTLAGFSDQKPPEEAGPEFTDDKAGQDEEAAPDFTEGDATTESASEGESDSEEGEEESAQTQAAAADQAGQQAQTVEPATKSTDVQLPDNSVTEARTPQGAEAVRAALNGAPVAEAWQQAAGVTLPPPGTPVTDPVPPPQLKAGDVGMWKDHQVMALGSGKVLVSGQVQPLESVSSGPDFLGWFDPTAAKSGSPAAAPAAD
ncbi:hypothetical protein BTO20_36950 (plasmid) [Mycobacterium dioxanotrophicus]|uniref:Biofilm regulator BssS n=1 Tax=Mycobacterium dioxanotrophicus TaxID=482462 RepID=A0A1Y0CG59_9MYCO|nr:DUF4226 domain-containing protein [Mycobacterium dioxanotrophicus]ART74240.1 hypothetical protein BTO20_36950 [Mycobacterium dioxanotrophicus]